MTNLNLRPQLNMERAAISLQDQLDRKPHPQRIPWGIVERLEASQRVSAFTVRRVDLTGKEIKISHFTHTDIARGTDLAGGVSIEYTDAKILLESFATRLGTKYARKIVTNDTEAPQYEIPVINFHYDRDQIPYGSVPRRLRNMLVQGATVLTLSEMQFFALRRQALNSIDQLLTAQVWDPRSLGQQVIPIG